MKNPRRPGTDRWRLGFLAAAILTGITLWLGQRMEAPPPRPAESRHIPDFYLRDFSVVAMDEAGRPAYRLEGANMMHYADDGISEIDAPRLQVFQHTGAPWRLTSEHGRVSAGGEEVWLHGRVAIERDDTADSRVRITTQDMRVLPDKRYAETARPVTVEERHGVTTAVGLKADLAGERLTLLSAVRGIYAAP